MVRNPYTQFTPSRWNIPLVISAPHSGVEIPRGFTLPQGSAGKTIEDMSDTGVDQLAIPAAQTLGFPVLSSRFLRAFIDLNRRVDELDPLLIDGLSDTQRHVRPGSRVAAGLGLIPRLADAQTPIYPGLLSVRAVQSRIERYYNPYHAQLRNLISDCLTQFGTCLLIDLHSMPSLGPAFSRRCLALTKDQPTQKNQRFAGSPLNIVLGTVFGMTLPVHLEHQMRMFWQGRGLTVSMNRPYAGGYITEYYGKSVNAVQLEVCRNLYPGRDVSVRSKTMESLFTEFVCGMANHVKNDSLKRAAE